MMEDLAHHGLDDALINRSAQRLKLAIFFECIEVIILFELASCNDSFISLSSSDKEFVEGVLEVRVEIFLRFLLSIVIFRDVGEVDVREILREDSIEDQLSDSGEKVRRILFLGEVKLVERTARDIDTCSQGDESVLIS